MDDRTLGDLLRRFGLSDKEVDTYLAVLELGEAKASVVADEAGVSKRYVYSISEELERRGFVTVSDHVVPSTIRARPPEEVVGTLSGDLQSMRPALESRYSRAAPPAERFEVIKSRVTALKRVAELVGDAEEEVALALPGAELPEVEAELRAAVDRGVFVLLIVAGTGPDDLGLDLAGLASVARVWDEAMPAMLTADRQSGFVAAPEMLAESAGGARAIVFAQQRLGPVLVGSFLGNYWPMAQGAYVADAAALPATYRAFRHAVLQATLHERAGTDLRARIEGRLVHDDAETDLAGRVVGVRQGLLEPTSNSFPVENTIVVETDRGTYSIGGEGAFIEDVEAESVTLERAE